MVRLTLAAVVAFLAFTFSMADPRVVSLRRQPVTWGTQMRVELNAETQSFHLEHTSGPSGGDWWYTTTGNQYCIQGTRAPRNFVCLIGINKDATYHANAVGGAPGPTITSPWLDEVVAFCQRDGGSGCPVCLFPVASPPTPTAPTNLTATGATNSILVNLAWNKPSVSSQDYFVIEVSGDGGTTWQAAENAAPTMYALTVGAIGTTNLTPNKTYKFRVSGKLGATQTAPSNVVTMQTGMPVGSPPAAPTGLTATVTPGCFPDQDCGCQ